MPYQLVSKVQTKFEGTESEEKIEENQWFQTL